MGRLLYGVLYGLTTVLLYDLLLDANNPGFYDKLLQVPLLNLSVILLDRLARSPRLKAIDPSAWARAWAPRRRHLAYMGVYALAFGAMSASGHLGDEHPGQWTPYWEQACAADKRDACLNLYFLHDGYCADGSRVVVQRDRHPARRALRQSRRRRARRSTARARCNSPPAAITPLRSRGAACFATTTRPPPTTVHPARQQGSDRRSRAGRALRARLRVGVAGRLPNRLTRLEARDAPHHFENIAASAPVSARCRHVREVPLAFD